MSNEDNNVDQIHQRWTYVALILGYNELAKKGVALGDKVYFRAMRDHAESLFLEAGGNPVLEPTAWILEIETPDPMPRIRFREQDIELMRETVRAYDEEHREKHEK